MSQHYSNPKRADDPHALPDVEVFYVSPVDVGAQWREARDAGIDADDASLYSGPGWFWQSCFPGCLPDGDPNGPFATEAEALADAQEGCDDDDD